MNVKNRYLINDYLQDRNSLQDPRRITQQRTGTMLRSPSEMKMMGVGVNTTTQPTQPAQTSSAAVVPPIKQAPVQQPTQPTVAPESAPATGLTENDVNSILTTDHVQTQMNSVLTELLDFANRKFEYNAKESPLYTILQQQAAKEARIASGRAYSRAVANTGGFGSSYATLAAEEASRQVMAGLDDQQLALYQAAKDEWDSQWTSKLQQYQALQGMYGIVEEQENKQKAEANAAALGMNKDTYDLLVYAGQSGWYNGRNETELRTMLSNYAAGNPNIDVNAIVDQLKGGSGTVVQPGEPVLSEGVRNAAEAWRAVYGTAYSPGLMKAFLQTKGYTDEEINGAMEAQKNLAKGELLDQASMVDTENEAIDYGNMLGEALRNGTITQSEWESAIKTSSAVIRKEYVDKESLGGADLNYAAKLMKNGVMTGDDFREILKEGFKRDIKDIKTEKGKKFNTLAECRELLDKVYGILSFVEDGYMTREEAKQVVAPFLNDETVKEFYDKMDKIEGGNDKIARLEGVNSEEDKEAWEFMKEIRGSAN